MSFPFTSYSLGSMLALLYTLYDLPSKLDLPATLYTLHSTLYDLRSTLYDLPSKLYQLLSTLYVLHSTIYALHCMIYPLNSTSYYTLHSMLYTLRSTIYAVPSKHYLLLPALYALRWLRGTAFFQELNVSLAHVQAHTNCELLSKVEISSTSSCPSLFNEILGLRSVRCLKTQFAHVESGLEISSIGDQILTAGRQWTTHVFFSFNLKGKRSYL